VIKSAGKKYEFVIDPLIDELEAGEVSIPVRVSVTNAPATDVMVNLAIPISSTYSSSDI
jgi:hypothetical protein